MLKTVNALNSFVGTLLSLLIVIALGAGAWFAYDNYFAGMLKAQNDLKAQEAKIAGLSMDLEARNREIGQLQLDVEAKKREIERLATAVRLLKVDQRVAQIDVLSQEGSAEDGDLVTRFSFVEVDGEGKPMEEPRLFSVKGDMVYVDSWVVKFSDEYVEMGDPMRSTSICLFRRLFGETQKPTEGFALDPVGSQPAAYRSGGKMSELEQEIWSKFWHYANDPDAARELGVRAAHGEAPYQKLVPGKRYKVELRASGGLTFVTQDLPPDAKPPAVTETL